MSIRGHCFNGRSHVDRPQHLVHNDVDGATVDDAPRGISDVDGDDRSGLPPGGIERISPVLIQPIRPITLPIVRMEMCSRVAGGRSDTRSVPESQSRSVR